MASELVPIELGLPSGDLTTVWAPSWREDGEYWEAFLGRGDDLYGFHSTAELLAFVRSGVDHDLDDHPGWTRFAAAPANVFEADDSNCFDLVAVPEILAEKPSEESVADLADVFAVTRSLGEVCELAAVTKFFQGNPDLAYVQGGMDNFEERDGQRAWSRIRKAVAKYWDEVLDSIDEVITTPAIDDSAVSKARADIESAALLAAENDSAPAPEQSAQYPDGSIWPTAGIDPIKISFDDAEHYTLRCYLQGQPLFLGSSSAVVTFRSPRALARYLADDNDHHLCSVSTFEPIKLAAIDGSLEIFVNAENDYSFTDMAEQIKQGPSYVSKNQLSLAVELLTDVADYVEDAAIRRTLVEASPLRRLIHFVLRPGDATLLEPEPPFDDEAAEWRELEQVLIEHLDVN